MMRGMPRRPTIAAALDTPAVVVDLDRVDARIERWPSMRERGVALRPHAKTHKSLEFARRQLAAGAVGLTVATIGEAEVFADGGVDDLFIGYPVIAHGPKAERLRRLADRCRLAIRVDSLDRRRRDRGAFAGRRGRLGAVVVIEVDVGGARTGVRTRWRARRWQRPPSARARRRRRVHPWRARLRRAGGARRGRRGRSGRPDRGGRALRASGIDAARRQRRIDADRRPVGARRVTEERPGTYVFGDRQQASLAEQALDDAALLVAATVVSHGSGVGFVVDAGAKILAKDVTPFSRDTAPSSVPGGASSSA